MRRAAIAHVDASADITTVTTFLKGVVLTGGSDAAVLTVKAGGSGGTTVLVLKAAANTTVSANLHNAQCTGGVHATITGTAPAATFIYE